MSVSQRTDQGEIVLDFSALLLDTLGFTHDEFVAIGTDDGGWHTAVMLSGQAPDYVDTIPPTANVFYSVNPTRGPARKSKGRGKAEDVTRVSTLPADLDVARGKCADLATAKAVGAELSEILGCRTSAITYSGTGLHAYWPVSDGQIRNGDVGQAQALLRRWGRLVAAVAAKHGAAKVDTVSDLARMLRVPGSVNNKGEPIDVVTYAGGGKPLTLAEVRDRLTAAGSFEEDGDTATAAKQISDPAHWQFADTTCPYVATMVAGWETDTPSARHPWLVSQAIRLECARRLGCISSDDYQHARTVLAKRFTQLRAATGEQAGRYEIDSVLEYGIEMAAAKTDEQARGELGGHQHQSFFRKGVGLLVVTLADAVAGTVKCGFDNVDQSFYVYENGVYTPDNARIDAQVVRFLGEKWRPTHTANVLGVIRHHRDTRAVSHEPAPKWINTSNGMVDWKTGVLQPHSPDYGSTVQLPTEYHRGAVCPVVEKFLAEVLPPDCYTPTEDSPEGFIWEVIGYVMYSGNPLHIAIMLWGKGRNGKGALIRMLTALLGARNVSAVGLADLTENRFRAATLYGKVANLAGDLDPTWIKNTAMFKSITGNDRVQAERKFGHAFEFTPWALPVYSTNKPFGSADSSEGWNERWVVIHFPRRFGDGDKDPDLDAKLQADAELQGVMARGIRALPTLMTRGHLLIPPSVARAKKQFILASDAVRAWINEAAVLSRDEFTARSVLYSAYQFETALDGSKQLSNREFYNRIAQIAGISPRKRRGIDGFVGIRLKTKVEKAGKFTAKMDGASA